MRDVGALRARLERELLTRSLADFVRAGWHVHEPTTPLVWGRHLQALCEHLQAVVDDWAARQRDPSFVQRVRNLVATLPPGTLKSRVGAVFLIPWIWLRWPSLRAICMSTNPRVALRDSVYARDLIGSAWYQRTFRPTWQIRDNIDAKGQFANTAGGFRNAIGIDSRIIGERADLILVDDPHDPEEAISDALRTAVLERWDSSIANRVNDLASSIRVGICHRVMHPEDWAGMRIREGWCHLNLPCEYEAEQHCTTPLGFSDWRTVEGESIHPERFTPEVIAAEKQRCGPLRWAALYQQRPAPAGGSIVKLDSIRWWREPGMPDAASSRPRGSWQGPSIEIDPRKVHSVVIACDTAAGRKTKSGDYNVIVAVGRWQSKYVVLDFWRARADFPEVQAKFKVFAERWPMARKVIERAAAGGSLESALRADGIAGLVSVPAKDTKLQRLHAVLAFFLSGDVVFNEHAPGLHEVIQELITFSGTGGSAHDDFVDALTLGLSQSALVMARNASPVAPIVHSLGYYYDGDLGGGRSDPW